MTPPRARPNTALASKQRGTSDVPDEVRQIHRANLAKRVQRFLDSREVDNPSLKEEAFKSLLASALVEAEKDCDCDVVSAWVESDEGCISICTPRSVYQEASPDRPDYNDSLLASALLGEINLFSFELFGAQKRNQLSSLVAAAVSPPFQEAPPLGPPSLSSIGT